MEHEVGLLEGMVTTRAIRRFRSEPVAESDLAKILFCATRAPSGSNGQPARFMVLRDGEQAKRARSILGKCFRTQWADQRRSRYGYDQAPAGTRSARVDNAMQQLVDNYEDVPVVILVCSDLGREHDWGPRDGGSIFPAIQNLLLAARALGYGGVISGWHRFVDDELHEILGIPSHVALFATVSLGRPEGSHGPVRRRPLPDVVFEDTWGAAPAWAIDPPGTRFSGGPPPR